MSGRRRVLRAVGRSGSQRHAATGLAPVPLVSLIIPVLWDASSLAHVLERLDGGSPDASATDMPQVSREVIVVNGDTNDAGVAGMRRRFPRVRWIDSRPGRAVQMNAGARVARGRWLWFVHADTEPDPAWLTEFAALDVRDFVGGAFRFRLASPVRFARLIEWGVRFRVRGLGLPYGDQGLFVRRAVFEAMGGFAPLPIMEDVEFVRRLRRHGRLWWSRVPINVSPRRWEHDGWLRRSLLNLGLLGLYTLGVAPARLARAYYGHAPEAAAPRPAVSAGAGEASASRIAVIIPALDEQAAIGLVLDAIPDIVHRVVVVDNGSTDRTAEIARCRGAEVVHEPRRGYGRACRAGLDAAAGADIIVFLDADRSDDPAEMTVLLQPLLEGRAELVLSDRREWGRVPAARLGTRFCVAVINWIWGTRYRDLGPFRAIKRSALERLGMTDATWGWTIEMQVKAAEAGLAVVEIPVRQLPRIGQSKISGTVLGTIRAGSRMLAVIWLLWRTRARRTYR